MNERASHFVELTRFYDHQDCRVVFYVDAHIIVAIAPIILPEAERLDEADVAGSVVSLSREIDLLNDTSDTWWVKEHPASVRLYVDEALRVSDRL